MNHAVSTSSPDASSASAPASFGVVGGRSVAEIVMSDLPGVIEQVRRAYLAHEEGRSALPHSSFLRFADRPEARIIALPAHLGAPWALSGLKWISSFPGNVAQGLPRASAALLLNRHDNGFPFACLEASIISAARTAASAVLAAQALMPDRRHLRRLAIIGTGLIAGHVQRFLVGTGWRVDEWALHDLDATRAQHFAARLRDAGQTGRVATCDDAASAIAGADLVLLTTVAGVPHLHDPRLFAGVPLVLHLSLRDLAPAVVMTAHNIVDDIDHALRAGTSLALAEQACGHRRFVAGTLAQVLQGRVPPAMAGRPTVFSPFGLGVLDIAVGQWVYNEALRRGQVTLIDDFFPAAEW